MLTLWGARERFCDGISRRGFMKIGALGVGLSLADVYRLRALAGPTVRFLGWRYQTILPKLRASNET